MARRMISDKPFNDVTATTNATHSEFESEHTRLGNILLMLVSCSVERF
jgi:hypothetical protein